MSDQTSRARTLPTGIKAPRGARVFQVDWADGFVGSIPHSILRGYCPCAGCQGHSGTIRFHSGGDEELLDIATVGNYALQLTWGDRHDSGLYSFRYLRLLSEVAAEEAAAGTAPVADDRRELPRL